MSADHVRLEGDQLIAVRRLSAAPTLVWEAFTRPEHLAAFWGGDHATVPPESVSVDLRVGGRFELKTVGADGSDGHLSFRYEVVDPPNRLVLSEARTGLTTEIFIEARGTGTVVTVHQRELPAHLRTERARTGLAGILRRLDVVVDRMTRTRSEQR